jgi:hypothetical protein
MGGIVGKWALSLSPIAIHSAVTFPQSSVHLLLTPSPSFIISPSFHTFGQKQSRKKVELEEA